MKKATILLLLCFAGCTQNKPVEPDERPKSQAKQEAVYKSKPATFWLTQLKDKDVAFRLEAINALKEIGPESDDVVLALLAVLKDKDRKVQEAAAEAFSSFPPEPTTPVLVKAMKSDDHHTRLSSVILLGRIGPKAKAAIPLLKEAVQDDDLDVSRHTLQSVTAIAPEEAVAVFILALGSKHDDVRDGAVVSLGKIGPKAKAAIPALKKALKDSNADVRSHAADALRAVEVSGEAALLAPASSAEINPPAYVRDTPQKRSLDEDLSALQYSRVRFHLSFKFPVQAVALTLCPPKSDVGQPESKIPAVSLIVSSDGLSAGGEIVARADAGLRLKIKNKDGESTELDWRKLRVHRDLPPVFSDLPQDLSEKKTRRVKASDAVAIACRVSDDYGVDGVALRYRVNNGEVKTEPIRTESDGGTSVRVRHVWRLLGVVKPRDKVEYWLEATDGRSVTDGDQTLSPNRAETGHGKLTVE
jgi:hypothetical protein